MTTLEYIESLKKKLKAIEENKPLLIAVRDVVAEQVQRIFIRGENASGSPIGAYNSTDPLYVNPKNSPQSFSPAGKPGAERNVTNRQTRWFASYKDFRGKVGRETGRVNLSLNNDLQSDFSSQIVKGKNTSAPHNPVKISNNEYHTTLKREINVKKKSGMEGKYGEIFRLTSKEKDRFRTTVEFEYNKIFL